MKDLSTQSRAAAAAADGWPRYAGLPAFEQTGARHAWGVFGDGDQLGTLNWITPQVVTSAAAEVRAGEVVNLSLPLTEPRGLTTHRPALVHTVSRNRSGRDDHLDSFYLQASTQWDGLAHVRYREYGYYGGREEEDLDRGELGMDTFAERGLVTRGVLADVAAWRAAQGDPVDPRGRDVITPDTLDAVLAAQGTSLRPGDILLVRTGWLTWYKELDESGRAPLQDAMMHMASPGLDPGPATAAWLWDHRIAAAAADNVALAALPVHPGEGFLHRLLVPLLGLRIGELWDLDGLAAACRGHGRHTFLLTSAPLYLHRGVGTPANAYAVL
jgi:kynurenine formamidase